MMLIELLRSSQGQTTFPLNKPLKKSPRRDAIG
jgi:hypothetical protein